jgi:ABC-type uncharacterized transport system permease subunit
VSLAETLTEKSGRVNLGLEGTLLMGAMSGYGASYLTGSAWLGVLVAAAAGGIFGLLHAAICNLPRVNDVAVGIGLFIFGTGLAFFLGKPFVQPQAPRLPTFGLGEMSDVPAIRAALDVSPLFFAGILGALAMRWVFANTRWGLIVRAVGDNAEAARAAGYPVNLTRTLATAIGGLFARVAGVPLALVSRHLGRGPFQRPGPDGGDARDLCPLESAQLLLGVAAVRRCVGARSCTADGGRHGLLLPDGRRTLRVDPRAADCQLFAPPPFDRCPG